MVVIKYRLIVALALIFLLASPASAQSVVTAEPALPTLDAPVTIYFHADRGTGGLADYSGSVYAHTGIITSESDTRDGCGGVDWQHVKTAWGENAPDTRLERVEENLYRLHIADIRSYYGATDVNEEIYRLAFVFRSGEQVGGSYLEGKADGGCDIFVDLVLDGLGLDVLQPVVDAMNPFIAERDTTIEVQIVARADTSIIDFRLLLYDVVVAEETPAASIRVDTLHYDLTLEEAGRVDLQAVAGTAAGALDTVAFYAIRNPDIVESPRPAGLQDGITYGSNGVTLSLFAPHKEYVYVIGEFTGWEVKTDFFMNKETTGPDSTWFWITLENLNGTLDQGFQYLVDGEIRVADPYSQKLLTEQDQFISNSTYPGLESYPQGKTQHPITQLFPSNMGYDWQTTSYDRPEPEELVIYELLLRDFLHAHDFVTLIDTLDYLERLGVNAIELMPIMEFDGNISWGYNPAFHFAVDKYYGPAGDLKRLVDEAHARDMAVILDVVYNHVTGQSPLARLYNEGAFGNPTPQNPWLNVEAPHSVLTFFNDINHESAATQYWMDRNTRYWLEEFRVDGFRFDLSKGFTQTPTDSYYEWAQYDASRIRLIKRMADQIWAVDDSAIVILEHFAEPAEEYELIRYRTEEGLPGMLVWNNMNRTYSQAAMGYLNDSGRSSDLSAAYPPNSGYDVGRRISYMESHDEQWLMYRNWAYAPETPGYDISSLPVSLDRMKMVGAFFFTIPGPRMMFQFGELGYGWGEVGELCLRNNDGECPSIAPGRTAPKPIHWEYYDDPLRRKLYDAWAALINLRLAHDVFTSPETEVDMQVGQGVEARRIRLSLDSMQVVVIGNFGLDSAEIDPQFHQAGTWYDFFKAQAVEIADSNAPIALSPGEFHIYTSRPVEFPEEGLVTVGIDEAESPVPDRLVLFQNYPNPFNGVTTIRYSIPQAGRVSLDLYDILGRRVQSVVDAWQQPGSHRAVVDAEDLASGLYFYRLQAGESVETRRMLVVD